MFLAYILHTTNFHHKTNIWCKITPDNMVEAFIEHMWVMAGIFALLVIVVFSVRGGQKARRETVLENS